MGEIGGRALCLFGVWIALISSGLAVSDERVVYRNAYATMMYVGTPRDYEFYTATRVMLRSLRQLKVDADLVVIASMDVPLHWIQALEEEDGAKAVRVENIKNPYRSQSEFSWRFKLTLNKLYAWTLVSYDRVVMLDADNLFLQNTDELFQCGEFCAVFINPCIFHTGLFVLKPSMEVFDDMMHELEIGRSNPDGADQGFLGSYFPDLLDRPMFHPPQNGTKLDGAYRLPLGYQMDASYYYLRLRWSVPCGPNSVITFPGAPWMKPWYWWSWPVLPLGIQWHQSRLRNLGYGAETPIVLVEATLYVVLIAAARLARPGPSKPCHRRDEKSAFVLFKLIAAWALLISYAAPFFLVPRTAHPLVGWGLYLLGAVSLSSAAAQAFGLPVLPVVGPGIGILGSLLVMAYPGYPDGIVRALSVFGYALCCSPLVWGGVRRIASALQAAAAGREGFGARSGENVVPSLNKLC